MLNIPILRWGKPYDSLETDEVKHFITGEPIAKVSQANAGLLQRDMRKAQSARDALRDIPCDELIERVKKAGELYLNGTLPVGDGMQSPDDFARMQSASTGLPVHMCKGNMAKNFFVLSHMDQMLDALTRGLDLSILSNGYGLESRGVVVSYQAQSPVVGLVLPSNSPGVHTLWLPVIPMQIGLVLKPGPQEPWTPYRMAAAFFEAGIPREAISIYPGGPDVGAAVLGSCGRAMIFGGTATVERYKGNPKVQAHGPGFSKIILGDDMVDRWEEYIDLMADSIYLNSGRGCINCSGVWASRHTKEIAQALAAKLGPIEVKPPDDPASRAGRVYDSRLGRRRVESNRSRLEGRRSRTQHGQVRSAAGRVGTLRLSAADDRALQFAGERDRQEGIYVPVRHRRRVPARSDARSDRADAGLHGDHRRPQNSSGP